MALTLVELLPLGILASILLGIVLLLLHLRKTAVTVPSSQTSNQTPTDIHDTSQPPRNAVRRRRRGLDRMAAAAAATRDDQPSEIDTARATVAGATDATGRIKKKKEANREAKRQAREARLARLEEMRERELQREEALAEREAEEERKEREREERERVEREERERKEKEEYEGWKGMMELEEAGEEGDAVEEEDSEMLERFCGYVRERKIVVLEELAAEFGLKTEEVIDRLMRLEKGGGLTGFFDDRGKFIYVSPEEMEQVAEFIKRRGRVSIQELARESTRLLHLDVATASG